jgi:hypothetical protein
LWPCWSGCCGAVRYLEGALHLVVEQLLHLPKIPPATALGRCKKLACNLTLLDADDAGLGAAGAAHGSGGVVPVTSVLCRGQSQLVQQVTPGRRYLIDARLSCKVNGWGCWADAGDSHLMLGLRLMGKLSVQIVPSDPGTASAVRSEPRPPAMVVARPPDDHNVTENSTMCAILQLVIAAAAAACSASG